MDLKHWPNNAKGVLYYQGYLAITNKGIVRVRIKGDASLITVKSSGIGLSRDEFEYEIPLDEAQALLNLCQNDIIKKTRYKVSAHGKQWDVDKFHGKNKGLWLAEVELEAEDEMVTLPPWAVKEVTGNEHYYNAYISKHPFGEWDHE